MNRIIAMCLTAMIAVPVSAGIAYAEGDSPETVIEEGKVSLDRQYALYDEMGAGKTGDEIEPQAVKVLERVGNWIKIDTWLGQKWVNLGAASITISAAGDCTLGYDYRYNKSFMNTYEQQGRDITYFLRNVKGVFEESDLAIVNLEGTLTNSTAHAEKTFVFRGLPEFAKILSSSGVGAVTIANNHTYDYLHAGYSDTTKNLDAEGIGYFGNDYTLIKEVGGIKIGMFGFNILDSPNGNNERIRSSIKNLKESGAQLIVAYYHWGVERSNYPNNTQKSIGHFSIDEGCDLVLGSHPHVLQGIEEYKGKNIVYSLANFCFGGNSNPSDKDTFIFQQTFAFDSGELVPGNDKGLIPCLVSSERNRNNFQPVIATGSDADRILKRIKKYSEGIS